MPQKALICLVLLSASGVLAATPSFLLGIDYSEWADTNTAQIAVDGSGALYLRSTPNASVALNLPSYVTKLSADGKTLLWKNTLGFQAGAMAVAPNGGVYVTPEIVYGASSNAFVEKLSADGTSVAWQTQIGVSMPSPLPIAVDSTGRAFVAGYDQNNAGFVVRLNAAGTVDYATSLTGLPSAIAVDASGSEVVAETYVSGSSTLATGDPYGSSSLGPARCSSK